MSNMKDYAMWLDDQEIAKWDTVIGELIIPEGVNVFTEELLEQYHNDAVWRGHPPTEPPTTPTPTYEIPHDPEDNEVIIEDDDEDDGFLDDDELGDSWQLPDHLPYETATDYHLDLIGELI